jgi:hypothetical protein
MWNAYVGDSAFLLASLVTECSRTFVECDMGWIIFVAAGGYVSHVGRFCRNWTTVLIGACRCYAVLRPLQSVTASKARIVCTECILVAAALVLLLPYMLIVNDWYIGDMNAYKFLMWQFGYENNTSFDIFVKRIGLTFNNECTLNYWYAAILVAKTLTWSH